MDSTNNQRPSNPNSPTIHSPNSRRPGTKAKDWAPERVAAIKALFASFRLAFPFWQHEKSDGEIKYAKNLWLVQTQRLSVEAIERGVEKVIQNHNGQSGPTVSEFLQYARRNPAHQTTEALPLLPSDPNVGRAAIDGIRTLLGATRLPGDNSEFQRRRAAGLRDVLLDEEKNNHG